MPKNINAASRLHAILCQTTGMASNATVLAVWTNVFQVQEQNESRKALIISDRLWWLHKELESLRSQMQETTISEGLYTAALNNIEQAISTLLLSTTWNNGLQYLKPETLVALEFCSELLPDEESLIDPQIIEEIRSMVQELEGMIASSNLPESLIAMIRHHIELIHRALDQYPIIGAKAFRESARTALGELIEVKETIKESSQTEQVKLLGLIWRKVNDAADIAIKTDNLAQLGAKAWSFLEHYLPY